MLNSDESITVKLPMVRVVGEDATEAHDEIAVEYALTIVLDGEEFATMVCTPTHLEELVIGFLASEGIILHPDDIVSLSIDESTGMVDVQLRNKQVTGKDYVSKRFIGSCCGKSRQFYFHNDARTAKTARTSQRITPTQCANLMQGMQEASHVFRLTGGVHNAALCTTEGIVEVRTDIGRHNALDKIYGFCLRNNVPTKDAIIAFSGRISSEVLLKVAKIGAGLVLSKSAPTTLAIELARDLNITAIGFIRGGSMNVYSHPERVAIHRISP
jgi:FdhD protein